MALWDKLSTELRSAGKAARGAIDEGKLRLELFRIRQLADKAAQAPKADKPKHRHESTEARVIYELHRHGIYW